MMERHDERTGNTVSFIPFLEIKKYNLMINGLLDQPVIYNIRTYNNILKITIRQADNYTIGCLSYYLYFNEHYNDNNRYK